MIPLRVRVVTGTRAEYGLLRPLIALLSTASGFNVTLSVTGTHLSERFGMTVHEIEADGSTIVDRIPLDLDDDSEAGVTRATAAALAGFASAWERDRPDLVIILGDRFEALAAAAAALMARIPVAHLHGGELTEGAVDDAIRHSITKMSYLHFTATAGARCRVIQLGEDPERVFHVGALGVDNSVSMPRMSRSELESDLGIPLSGRIAVVTFHPVTLENHTAGAQMAELLGALEVREDITVVFTLPNADPGNRPIFEAIERFVERHPGRAHAFASLGARRYLSLLAVSDVCVGNSSSGIIEAPALGVPTVDIGDRQTGRERADSVIWCAPRREDILDALDRALTPDSQHVAQTCTNPYGNGGAAQAIVGVLAEWSEQLVSGDLKKRFHDVEGRCEDVQR